MTKYLRADGSISEWNDIKIRADTYQRLVKLREQISADKSIDKKHTYSYANFIEFILDSIEKAEEKLEKHGLSL